MPYAMPPCIHQYHGFAQAASPTLVSFPGYGVVPANPIELQDNPGYGVTPANPIELQDNPGYGVAPANPIELQDNPGYGVNSAQSHLHEDTVDNEYDYII